MGFVLTLIYVALAFVPLASIYPETANWRLQVWLGLLILVVSVLRVRRLHVPQTYLLLGLILSAFLSHAANRWIGGGIAALEQFVPNAIVFYFVLANFNTLARLRTLAILLYLIAAFYSVQGAMAYYSADGISPFLLLQSTDAPGLVLRRIRGLGFLNDPNDLGQFFLTVIPLLWLAWRPRHKLMSSIFIAVPGALLLWAVFLTHSRGAAISLAVAFAVALREKMGTVRSGVFAALILVALVAADITGGRQISAHEGSGRMAAWGAGVGFIKSSPLFGAGYGSFSQNYDIAAHNSFIQAAAELGVVGYFCWIGLLAFTLVGLNWVIRAKLRTGSNPAGATPSAPAEMAEGDRALPSSYGTPAGATRGSALALEVSTESAVLVGADAPLPGDSAPGDRTVRWAKVLRVALVSFLAAGFFLSRAYVLTLYLLLGMSAAVTQMAASSPEWRDQARPVLRKTLGLTAVLVFASVIAIYVFVKASFQGH